MVKYNPQNVVINTQIVALSTLRVSLVLRILESSLSGASLLGIKMKRCEFKYFERLLSHF